MISRIFDFYVAQYKDISWKLSFDPRDFKYFISAEYRGVRAEKIFYDYHNCISESVINIFCIDFLAKIKYKKEVRG